MSKMTVRCTECGGATTWDDDVGSAICTACGTMTDPSQSILTSFSRYPDNTYPHDGLWNPTAPATLKSLRGGNWDFAGQDRETRDRKNNYAMTEFINSLASSTNAAGLSPRSITLFNQAMVAGQFRWGRKARLVAGACLAIALREAKRPASFRDIAFLLDEPLPSLTQTFTAVISLLDLTLPSADPSNYVSALQIHLSSVLRDEQETRLHPSLVVQLKSLCLRSVASTANSLANLIARLGADHKLNELPSPPTACAVYILALEAEARSPATNLCDLATFFAARCDIGKMVVMSRYKIVQDEVATLISKVSWLDKYERKNGRAKVAKRMVVARGLKDVVKFQEEIWRQTFRPPLILETSNGDKTGASESESMSCAPSLAKMSTQASSHQDEENRPRKRWKTKHPLRDATRFLLNPLSAPIPSDLASAQSPKLQHPSRDAGPSLRDHTSMPLTSYLLTAPSASLIHRRMPSRLQLLAVARGGVGPEEIEDEELFEDGELEGLLRGEAEMALFKERCGWDEWCDAEESQAQAEREHPRRRKANLKDGGEGNTGSKPSERINMEALAKLLEAGDKDDDKDLDAYFRSLESDEDRDHSEEAGDNDNHWRRNNIGITAYSGDGDQSTPEGSKSRILQRTQHSADSTEVVVEEWRPLSPEAKGLRDQDLYDEEI